MRRPDRARPRLCWLVLVLLALSWPAHSHVPQLSTSELQVDGSSVAAELRINAIDVEAAIGKNAEPTAIAAYVRRHAVAQSRGVVCDAQPGPVRADGDQFLVSLRWLCPEGAEITYQVDLFREVDPAARHIVLLAAGQAMLGAGQDSIVLRDAPPMPLHEVVWRYVYAGIEHIFIGYDHVAFLIAALAWARRPWPVIKLVTAFTIAHSITLSLAALDLVVVPDAIVEPLIAASVVYVALENFFIRDVERRWRITGLFGLVHGFGFAGVLREFGLPHDALLVALGAFNVGVEIGQVAIVCLAIPLLVAADRLLATATGTPRRPATVYALSGVILALGSYWLAERTLLG